MTEPPETAQALRKRLPAVDLARGLALVAMGVYHATWDLAYFNFIDAGAAETSAMRLFSHAIAMTFLAVAGFSLTLAQGGGFRPRLFARHFAMVAGAAALVTAASLWLFPQTPIYFGILHCIAAASLLGLPLVFAPPAVAFAAAIAFALAPEFLASPLFNGDGLNWTGLNTVEPYANDYRPLAPWAAALFAGVGAGLVARRAGWLERLARPAPQTAPLRALGWAGRHSLAIYLVHQPLLFALFYSWIALAGPPATPQEAAFAKGCQQQCADAGAPHDLCVRSCACAARDLKSAGLWDRLMSGHVSPEEKSAASRIANACVQRGRSD
ncbi:MAG: DUF1624 domain-containing protein [Hyphomicrobiales bacterium]|nr:DUF1624 domain-containing protein [Hyphomicrobiales bacterium]